MDRRSLPGFAAAATGGGLALGGLLAGNRLLVFVAAAVTLVASAWALTVLVAARAAERRATIAVAELAALREAEATILRPSRDLIDRDTGLPDRRWFELTVEQRVAAARRHLWPVTVVLLQVHVLDRNRRVEHLAAFARLLKETLREADAACRIDATTFGLILEDTPEAGGVWAAERLQVAAARDLMALRGLAAGIATYPSHGLTPEALLGQARQALGRAVAADAGFGLGHVEVATGDTPVS